MCHSLPEGVYSTRDVAIELNSEQFIITTKKS